jgi:hypothetical protein
VSPVRLPNVPAIVELPVTPMPPADTVMPAPAVNVPADTVNPAENVCNAENVCAVLLCAAYVLIVAMLGFKYSPYRSARSLLALGTLSANGAPVVVARHGYASGGGSGATHALPSHVQSGGTN